MELITQYITAHSDGRKNPICSKALSNAFGVPSTAIRKMINDARSKGDPICSCSNGYYTTHNKEEIRKTIASIQGRIIGMNRAISGLEQCL